MEGWVGGRLVGAQGAAGSQVGGSWAVGVVGDLGVAVRLHLGLVEVGRAAYWANSHPPPQLGHFHGRKDTCPLSCRSPSLGKGLDTCRTSNTQNHNNNTIPVHKQEKNIFNQLPYHHSHDIVSSVEGEVPEWKDHDPQRAQGESLTSSQWCCYCDDGWGRWL